MDGREMEAKWETYTLKELLEMGLKCTHEAAHSLCVKHVYNGAVAETFWGVLYLGQTELFQLKKGLTTQ